MNATLLLIDPETSVDDVDRPPVVATSASGSPIEELDGSYAALQGLYGEAAALSTNTEQDNRWRTRSQRLRHLRLGVDEGDLYLVVTATAALAAEMEQVRLVIRTQLTPMARTALT